MVTVRNKFGTPERHTSNDEYENFITAHIEAADGCILTKQRAKRWVPWELTTRKNEMTRKNQPYPMKETLQMPMRRN